MNKKLPEAEQLKVDSRFLRGTILEGLADELTGAISEDDTKLTKFHGTYMQDYRDLRDERRRQKLEPLYSFMVRLRLPGGVLNSAQWLGLDDIADECSNGTLRLTTRQTFQYHEVYKNNLALLMQRTVALGLDTKGACGDVNRNVVTNVNPHESKAHKAVHKAAQEISDHLCWQSNAYAEIWLGEKCVYQAGQNEEPFYGDRYLPRKFKIAIAIPPHNDADIFANDIGLIAIIENGELLGFNVSVGGGMGMTYGETKTFPRLGNVVGFVTPDQVVKTCESIVAIQRDFGDRETRPHARFKYTIDDNGLDWFRDQFAKYHGEPLQDAKPFELTSNGDRFGWVQGDDGMHHLTLYVHSGRIADTDELQLRTAMREIAKVHTGEFRITCNQNLIIANISDAAKPSIEKLVTQYQLDDGSRRPALRLNAMACVALPTCALAMAESERYLPEFLGKLEVIMADAGLPEKLINIRMTGCPNGCARPYLGEIALTGKAVGRYNLFLGADFSGQRLNRLYLENVDETTILNTLRPLIEQFAKERTNEEHFGDFLVRKNIVEAERTPVMMHEAKIAI
ncbi:Sulfite reductase (NADPH) hemoprotein beta-component [Methylophaga frappieri]|uniref:Sulfite reductase [NADPH] hemoprotein beta-component n=1 Tax=Methylophaga frappieri (strain ATCC BAA-2434 / DSM 25690 / JAM7) TaxID=754477 RepID=I1YF57_METFJ|nr:NADPH-dependent assimilatory sulfite reductase hemoprotein subunit [Methylophaga frappieri]AFJ01550.1 Sulfite reductase (NADPH) hemoprotein beta-component [Methylophaga frappieri]